MYQCVSDRFDTCRGLYESPRAFLNYCQQVFGRAPTLIPDMPDADNYYDYTGFVLVKLKEGDNAQALGCTATEPTAERDFPL